MRSSLARPWPQAITATRLLTARSRGSTLTRSRKLPERPARNQIAGELGTTEATVKEQRGHVMAKMQAGSVAELVHFASRLGITPAGGGKVLGADHGTHRPER